MKRKILLKLIRECLLRLLIKNCLKNILRYGKKISDLVGKKFHNNLYYEDDKNNSRISIINDEIKTNFHNNVEPKQKVAYNCFSLKI